MENAMYVLLCLLWFSVIKLSSSVAFVLCLSSLRQSVYSLFKSSSVTIFHDDFLTADILNHKFKKHFLQHFLKLILNEQPMII